ncbi:methyltransferase [Labrys okinawensis]|uniref:Methyltransferase n=1 Tax=Labrys okinawensis TaxID=346911 RepID=A0A2S9Q5D1_9HYPH|nr:class I SAM-dependent methyltransferase [Labrys okinawensis]PRH84494.1 methyltransferase [Labrys okinawensis]
MEKISLSQEKETLLITLYAKGEESRLPDSLLQDRFAASAVDRIDYDFSRLGINRDMMIGLAMRAHILDNWARAFLAFHPEAIVLHLGCGLDSRVFRIDPPATVRWFDVDYPEVIELRRRLYPERAGYQLIGSSVTDPAWLEAIAPEGRPALILAEGMFPYLPADQAIPLLDRLASHFHNGEIAFDAYNSLGLRMIRKQPSVRATGAQLNWSLGDPHDIERQVPRLKLMQELLAYDSQGYDPAQIARMSRSARLAVWLFKAIPALGRVGRLLRYRF